MHLKYNQFIKNGNLWELFLADTIFNYPSWSLLHPQDANVPDPKTGRSNPIKGVIVYLPTMTPPERNVQQMGKDLQKLFDSGNNDYCELLKFWITDENTIYDPDGEVHYWKLYPTPSTKKDFIRKIPNIKSVEMRIYNI